ncbi:MAG: non-heme iron oxygenase ferredoxin subunit [Firmicutes bacterium]|nr:non-heme iron oxygenase ferredoxin subunit [Bacillota bacterium]
MERLPVASLKEFPVGAMKRVDADGDDVLLVHLADGVYAIDDICTHGRVSLADGWLEGEGIVCCPKHGGKFDVRTGKAVAFPAISPLRRYQVVQDGDVVYLELTD